MITFTTQSMQTIIKFLEDTFKQTEELSFITINPDTYDHYAGESIEVQGISYIYRSYKSWTDLAELLLCKMLTPKPINHHLIQLTFVKLKKKTFHTDTKHIEKYGTHSHFFTIHKMEEPAFLYYYQQALHNVTLSKRTDILNLGINRGDEFKIIKNFLDIKEYEKMHLLGIDHSQSAIHYAKNIFKEKNVTFYTKDITDLDTLGLGQFDLLISIGTLQSPSIPFKAFFMHLIQTYMKHDAAIILGFPNSRWLGGEMIYGAKAPHYQMSEMSLLFNDVIFCKKYLQQKKYRVTITGKQYIFLTATKMV